MKIVTVYLEDKSKVEHRGCETFSADDMGFLRIFPTKVSGARATAIHAPSTWTRAEVTE